MNWYLFAIISIIISIILVIFIYKNHKIKFTKECLETKIVNNNKYLRSIVTEKVKIRSNNSLVLYGNIPYRYFWWSIIGSKVVSTLDFPDENNNDGICIIVASNVYVYEETYKEVIKKWRRINDKLSIIPMYVDTNQYHNLTVEVGFRDTDIMLPKFTTEIYTYHNFNNYSKPNRTVTKPYNNQPSEYHLIKESKFNLGISKIVNLSKSRIIKTKHLDNINSVTFKSKLFELNKGDKLTIIAVNHSKSISSVFSTVTLFDHNHKYVATIMSGDFRSLDDCHNKGLIVALLKYTEPNKGQYYIVENIYPDIINNKLINPKNVISATGYIQ